jgi:hypothetical protein
VESLVDKTKGTVIQTEQKVQNLMQILEDKIIINVNEIMINGTEQNVVFENDIDEEREEDVVHVTDNFIDKTSLEQEVFQLETIEPVMENSQKEGLFLVLLYIFLFVVGELFKRETLSGCITCKLEISIYPISGAKCSY